MQKWQGCTSLTKQLVQACPCRCPLGRAGRETEDGEKDIRELTPASSSCSGGGSWGKILRWFPFPSQEAGRTCLGSILKGGIVLQTQPSVCVCVYIHMGGPCPPHQPLPLPHNQMQTLPPLPLNQPQLSTSGPHLSPPSDGASTPADPPPHIRGL